ncbi:MAG: cytochrome c biogenesis heme-transporting ATPase CcmA [Arenicellales bacterium]
MPAEPTTTELEIRDLACVRGDRLLFRELDLALAAGELVQVTGPNGCGKTSFLRIVCGLALAEIGTVLWHREATRSSERFKQDCAYVGHRDGLKADLSARENLSFHSRLSGGDPAAVDTAIERLELTACRDILAGHMSAGQRRRTALARLLLARRRLWILDEPFTSLDVRGRGVVEDLLIEHQSAGGLSLFASHQALQRPELGRLCRELSLSA